MSTTTFSGPIKAGSTTNSGYVLMAQSGLVNWGADASTTTVATIPANSQILDIHVDVVVAFDAGTTNTLSLGDGTTADQFASALDVSSLAKVLGSSDVSQLPNYDDIGTADVTLVATYNQTGGAATAGQAVVTVLYLQDRNIQ
jgi:hypothetical protein